MRNWKERSAVGCIVGIYVIFSGLWIFLSDTFIGWIVHDQAIIIRLSIFKGFLFIIVTAAILYHLIASYARRMERELAERSQAEKEASFFRTMVEYTRDPVYVLDPKDGGKMVYANQAACIHYGKTLEELLTMRIPDWDPDFDTANLEPILQDMRKGKPIRFETRHRVASGKLVPVEVTANLLLHYGRELTAGYFYDISERKAMENELREKLHFLHKLLDAIPTPVFYKDNAGHYVICNRAFEEFMGFPKERKVGGAFCDLAPGILADSCNEGDAELLSTPGTAVYETSFSNNDGSRLDVIFNKATYIDADGEVAGIVGAVTNVTPLKTAEKSLRENAEEYRALALEQGRERSLLRALIDSIPDLIFIKDHESVYLGCNRAFEAFAGRSEEELIGLTDLDMFPVEVAEFFREMDRQMLLQGVARSNEEWIDYPDGRHVLLDTLKTPYYSQDGTVLGLIGISRDITERYRAEYNLRQKEICLKGILEATADGILAVDEKGKIIRANRRFAELWRIPEAMIDSGDDELLLEFAMNQLQEPEAFLQKVRSLYGTDRTDRDTLYFRDGRIFERSSAPLVQEGDIIGRVWSFRDITDKRRMEDEILRAQKLESVGLLAGGIAHDFNNLLTAVLGNISLAKALLPPQDRTQPRLREAEKATLRARDLTQQLLTFSKGGAPVRRSASIADLIRETAGFALSGSNVRCEFAICQDLHPIEIDEGQISQVIHNLIINAEHAMPAGGTLRLACSEITLAVGEVPPLGEGRYIRIAVSDQGMGIHEEHLQRIFEPFFTTKEKGRGLGLASAYSIIRNHQGQITVSSAPGSGATFTIHLPVSDMAVEVKPGGMETIRRGSGKILVMDDEETVLEIATEMLAHLGYEAVCARDGAEAVDLYSKAKEAGDPFAAVIADLTIPGGIGGREMNEQLRKSEADVKVIVSSGYSNDPIMSEYRSFGFRGVICKPYRIEELSEVLAEVLG
jgi:PAS domain S-box-containing protein